MTIKSHFNDKPRFRVMNGCLSQHLLRLSRVFHLIINKTLKKPAQSITAVIMTAVIWDLFRVSSKLFF